MDSIDTIERDYKSGEVDYINAVARLEVIGLDPLKAEMKVNQWDDDVAVGLGNTMSAG